MPDKVVGLDISDSAIKAVQVSGGLRGFQVTACAVVPVEPGEDEGLRQAMGVLRDQFRINGGASCATTLPADRISFRNLTLPFNDKKKIEQTIGYELEPLLPFPVDTVTTSYIASDGADTTPVLSACVRDDVLQEHLSLLNGYAFDPDVVEVGNGAIAVHLKKQEDLGYPLIILDIGKKTSSLTLLMDGITVLVRSFHFGGEALTKAIAETENIPMEQAEAVKHAVTQGQYVEIAKPLIALFTRQIHHTLHAFRCQLSNDQLPLKKAYLTGGGGLFPDMPKLLQRELGFPVERLDLGKQMNIGFDEDILEDWNPLTMNNALALALRETKAKSGFNLRAGKFKKERRYDLIRNEWKRFAIYASIVLFVLSGQFGADYYVLKKQKNHLEGRIQSIFTKTMPDVKRIVDPVHQMKVKIQEVKDSMLVPADAVVQRTAVDLLRDVSLRIPKTAETDLASLVLDLEKVRIKGLTDNFNTVDEIKNGLQDSEFFKDVNISSAQLDRKTDKVRFELVMVRK